LFVCFVVVQVSHAYRALSSVSITLYKVNLDLIDTSLGFRIVFNANKHSLAELIPFSISLWLLPDTLNSTRIHYIVTVVDNSKSAWLFYLFAFLFSKTISDREILREPNIERVRVSIRSSRCYYSADIFQRTRVISGYGRRRRRRGRKLFNYKSFRTRTL